MKIIDTVAQWIVRRALDTRDSTAWRSIGYAAPTAAGITVTNDNALQVSTVFACMRAISEDIAKLPLKIFQDDGTKRVALYDSYLYQLLKDKPNPCMTAMAWREMMTASALGWGNAYSLIVRGINGQIVELWPLRPDRVTVRFGASDKSLTYEVVDDNGNRQYYSSYFILHIHGLGSDGMTGYNVIQYARESLGSAKAAEKFGAKFFGNGAHPGAVFKHPAQMTDKAYARLKESLSTAYTGDNAHRPIITEEGMDFVKTSFAPEEAQFLETRQFSVSEICRWFRMPPNKVADTTRAQGWSTIEQTNIDYVTDTLMPWLIRWEQAINATLLTQDERNSGYYARHIVDALLRGDTTARYNAYAVGRQWGWLSVNDIREKEDLNPVENGDEYLVPLNMIKASAGDEAAKITAEQGFKREILKAFLADKTTNDTIFNMTNMRTLMQQAGIELEPNYIEPWLPITTANAPMVSGGVVKDNEGDIVGGDTIEQKTDTTETDAAKTDTTDDSDGGEKSDADDSGETDDSNNEKDMIDETSALVADAAARIASSEIREIEKHIKNKNLSAWLDSFYAKHERYSIRTLRPIMHESDVYAMQMISENRFNAGDDFSAWSKKIEIKHKEFICSHIKQINRTTK